MSTVEQMSEAERHTVRQLRERKGTAVELGQLDALRLAVVDRDDQQLIRQAVEHQQEAS